MKRSNKILFSTAAAALAISLVATSADAQFYGDASRRSSVIFVTPDGRILDQVPYDSDVMIAHDRRGRRVLVDRYGNLIATETRARNYYPQPPSRDDNYSDDRLNANARRDYGYGYGNRSDDYYGGGYNQPGRVDRGSLNEPAYGDRNNGNDGYASIDPQATQPATEPHRYNEPTITLKNKSQSAITALQVFLDRAGASPGAIDGRMGANVSKAIYAYQKMTGETLDPNDTDKILNDMTLNGGPPLMNYTITPADAAGPYVASIPQDYAQKATMTSLGYTSVAEMLAERFHMDEDYLKALNKGANFTIPGTIIKVANVGSPKTGEVAKIIADKGRKQVFAYDASGKLIAAYPSTIGSTDTPSPSGTVTIERIAFNPGYTYNPKINFKQGSNDKVLDIPPGPNGPVGNVWMALSKPTYGIHGTPDPSTIGKSQSHGCVRLTNWDANELAKMVKPGVTVEFIDG